MLRSSGSIFVLLLSSYHLLVLGAPGSEEPGTTCLGENDVCDDEVSFIQVSTIIDPATKLQGAKGGPMGAAADVADAAEGLADDGTKGILRRRRTGTKKAATGPVDEGNVKPVATPNQTMGAMCICLAIILIGAQCFCYHRMPKNEEPPTISELRRNDIMIREPEGLEASTYTLAIATIIRNSYNLAHTEIEDDKRSIRYMSIVFSVTFALITSVVTIGLVWSLTTVVAPVAVESTRIAYAQFEETMYRNGKIHPENFDNLEFDMKHSICQIPLSQPIFFASILLVWSITVLGRVKLTLETLWTVCWDTPTIDCMSEALHIPHEEEDEPIEGAPKEDDGIATITTKSSKECPEDALTEDKGSIVGGLTMPVKISIAALIVPWAGTYIFALWIGCRWLCSTNDWGGLIGNCLALEFMLHIEDLFYGVTVSDHHKQELESILFVPGRVRERLGWFVIFNGISWAIFAGLWVYYYIYHFQMVLPEYRWDLHQLCNPWLEEIRNLPLQYKPA